MVWSLLLVALFVADPAAAQVSRSQTMTYDVYAGGVHAVGATLKIEEKAGRYTTALEAKTIGFLKRLAPWSGQYASSGWIKAGQYQPQKHTASSVWKDSPETKQYTFDKSGKFLTYKVTEDGKDKTPLKLDPTLTPAGTTDVLSATLIVMNHLNQGGACSGTSTIFDGDRNFAMIFKPRSQDKLLVSDYNIYNGPAASCTVEVKPGAGKWSKKPRGWLSIQEQGRKKGTLPTIWFARVGDQGTGSYIPVRIQVKTDYGVLFMHLTSYQGLDGEKQIALVKKTK